MQAFSAAWSPPGGVLGELVARARQRAAALEGERARLEMLASGTPAGPSLAVALRGSDVALLAEVKRRSPSKGSLNLGIDAVAQAQAFALGGARGVSVLTEPDRFGGSAEDLRRVRAEVVIPALKKDFHVAPVQLLEARALGASAVLLIARALSPAELPEMAAEAQRLGLEVLVEIRDAEELERALATGCAMVGVNNRNLETLEIDPATSERLIGGIPASRVAIAESGMRTRADVERAAAAGADAVLVGSALSQAPDAEAAVRELAGVPVQRSGSR